MGALFRPWANTAFRLALFSLAAGIAGLVALLMVYARTPFATQERVPVAQPIEFDHRHHVADAGIDCRYCHSTVERAPSAGIPSTAVCMGCHAQIWNESPLLEPVRQSFFSGRPLTWRRVHRLPDFVYFDHSIHVSKGLGCATCHGRVEEMAAVARAQPLTMGWCLDCHRAPERFLSRAVDVRPRTSCTVCHR